MNVALRRSMTVAEFLAWDETQEDRWEFDGFEPVAMVGGTIAHNLLCTNLQDAIRRRLPDRRCEVFRETVRLETGRTVRYPDVVVACSRTPRTARAVTDPVVVFEVLSPGTASADIVLKAEEYLGVPSILRYVILAQDRIAVSAHERRGDGWHVTSLTGSAATLHLPELGIELPLAELYDDVFDPE